MSYAEREQARRSQSRPRSRRHYTAQIVVGVYSEKMDDVRGKMSEVEECPFGVLLLFADDEVADEVAGMGGRLNVFYHTIVSFVVFALGFMILKYLL